MGNCGSHHVDDGENYPQPRFQDTSRSNGRFQRNDTLESNFSRASTLWPGGNPRKTGRKYWAYPPQPLDGGHSLHS